MQRRAAATAAGRAADTAGRGTYNRFSVCGARYWRSVTTKDCHALHREITQSRSHACSQRIAVGCGSFSGMFAKTEDPQKMAVEGLYRRAKDALQGGNYAEAIKLYETLSRAFHTVCSRSRRFSIPPTHSTSSERAQAISAADRFIKLYPNHERRLRVLRQRVGQLYRRPRLTVSVCITDLSERDQKSAREAYHDVQDAGGEVPAKPL